MKKLAKFFLKYYLKYLAKISLLISRPTVIAVAGSINKTFAKNRIEDALNEAGLSVRSNPHNFNTEIGLPLAVLGLPSGYNSYKAWLPTIIKALPAAILPNRAQYLVLELGVSDAGDMKHLLTVVRPRIVVVTNLTQRYLEAFSDMDELISEYEYLVRSVPANGLVLLNNDVGRIKAMARMARAKCVYYGLGKNSEWQATSAKTLSGQRIDIIHDGVRENHEIKHLGDHNAYAFLIGRIIKDYVINK